MTQSRTEPRGRPFQRGVAPPNKGRRFPPEIVTEDEAWRLIRAPSNRAPTGIRNRALLDVMYRGGLRIGLPEIRRSSDRRVRSTVPRDYPRVCLLSLSICR
jgi:site-specific recombinase XerC